MATSSLPSTIKRWQYNSVKGGLEKNLFLNQSFPMPTPKANQHLVKVLAVALNPVDHKPTENPVFTRFISKPATPGIDLAAQIVTPAPGSSFKPGDLVFGVAGTSPFAAGGLSQYTTVPKDSVIPIPSGVTPINAASIPVAGLTAFQTIVPRVKKGDSIFLNGGSGGCGIFGIQIAKAVGCHVTTSCSTPNVELCKSLGADVVVDYKKGSVATQLAATGTKFDHIVDNVGSDLEIYWRCHEFTKPGAVFILIAGTPSLDFLISSLKRRLWPGFLGGGKRKCEGFFAAIKPEQAEQIALWMASGEVKPVIDQKFSFEQVPEAFQKLKTGRARGKIIVVVDPEVEKL